MLPVVLAVLHLDEVVHIHKELRSGAGAAEHRAHHKHHIDEASAERLEVGRGRRVAADRSRAADEPGVHSDGRTVIGEAGLVVLVDEVRVEQFEIAVGELLAVHLLDAVGEQAAVQADEVALGQLSDEGCDVLVLDVGVGVELRTGGGVGSFAVVGEELHLAG